MSLSSVWSPQKRGFFSKHIDTLISRRSSTTTKQDVVMTAICCVVLCGLLDAGDNVCFQSHLRCMFLTWNMWRPMIAPHWSSSVPVPEGPQSDHRWVPGIVHFASAGVKAHLNSWIKQVDRLQANPGAVPLQSGTGLFSSFEPNG